MSRTKIAEFGIIQKNFAGATVAIYDALDGENTGTLATLYQAATGTGTRSNPQVLDSDGKLEADCYVEGEVIAAISNITLATERSIRKIRVNPLEYPLPYTSAKTLYQSTADNVALTNADVLLTNADVIQTGLDVVATAADRVQTALDVIATAADRVQTGLDVIAASGSAADAAASSAEAAASAAAAGFELKVSTNDDTPGYLGAKTSGGTGITKTELYDGGNEVVEFSATLASQAEAEAGTVENKLMTPLLTAQAIAALVYPVGSYYLSDLSTNPSTVLGFGTWVAVEGKMLIGANGTYTAGSEGGSATTTQTTSTLASHRHTINGGGGTGSTDTNIAGTYSIQNSTIETTYVGSGNAMTTISPYRAVYIWRRTA